MSSRTGGRPRGGRKAKGRSSGGDIELLSQRVFSELERAIIHRVHPPGTHLVEEEVAAELGVSRMPVREAFRMLQREGWLDIQPYMGAYVRQPPLSEVRDIFELRHRLGAFAAQLAAIRAMPEELDELKRILAAGWAAVERSDMDALAELNWEFHRTLASSTGNELLRRQIDELDKRMRWHFASTTTSRASESWAEHQEIVEAVAAHDAERAGRLTFDHSRRSEAAFLQEQFSALPVDDPPVAAQPPLAG